VIFTAVGNCYWKFNRLIEEMDRIAGNTDEEVVIQIGFTKCEPKNARYFTFTSNEEINDLFENVRVIVAHAGVGTIVKAISHKKPIIVVPRRHRYGEHYDDHQVEIANALDKDERVTIVWDVKELEGAINDANWDSTTTEKDKQLVIALRDYVSNLEEQSTAKVK
jgi:UDP-N-acetylglucosamine transferase subunit ALG13